jgi:exonuclease SbcC
VSQIDASFEALTEALKSLYSFAAPGQADVRRGTSTLLLQLPTDVAAFAVCNGKAQEGYDTAYAEFRQLYREHHKQWDNLTLSFVVCRSTEKATEDRFYAALEHDPLFCRKYVIRAFADIARQREELLRLPFLPLPDDGQATLQRPQAAQDLLQTAGLSASLSRKLIESGHRSPERIAADLRDGTEELPARLEVTESHRVVLTKPRASSRLLSATIEGFRAFQKPQHFDLDASVIVLYGPNGLGKTSFFDAIDYACTGRIGRLCRQQRTQSDFARLATHLDRTPGTGSVILTGRTEDGGPSTDPWTLKRATGDWSTAWIDEEERTRKQVLTFLTNATWIDSRPRQQTLESLFRATHLFGQDEQELLIEFRKASVIPEEFISEMLALQDYSQGLTKVQAVEAALRAALKATKAEADDLQRRIDGLADVVKELNSASEGPDAVTPMDTLVEQLRAELAEAGVPDALPAESITLVAMQQCEEVLAAHLSSAEERQALAASLVDVLPSFRRLSDDLARAETALAAINQEAQTVAKDARECAARVQSHETDLSRNASGRSQLEKRLRELRDALNAVKTRDDIQRQMEGCRAAVEPLVVARNTVDARMSSIESDLTQVGGESAKIAQRGQAARSTLDAVTQLVESFDRFQGDAVELKAATDRVAKAHGELQSVQAQIAMAEQRLRDTRASREALRPQYEAAIARQADLERLLDSIQTYIRDEQCPLCGTDFESKEALLRGIHQRRGTIKEDQEVSSRYNALLTQETTVSTEVQSGRARLSSAQSAIAEAEQAQEAASARLETYRERLADIGVDRDGSVTRADLAQRQQQAADAARQVDAEAAINRRAVQQLEASKQASITERESIGERMAALELEQRTLTDNLTQANAVIHAVIEREAITEAQIEFSRDQMSGTLEQVLSRHQDLVGAQEQETLRLTNLKQQEKDIEKRRAAVLETIERLREGIAEPRRQMSALSLPDKADDETVARAVSLAQLKAGRLRTARGTAAVAREALQLRERRLQLAERASEVTRHQESLRKVGDLRKAIAANIEGCLAVERLLTSQQQRSIEGHIEAYGPLITNIQQRLRSVYGFGGVQLQARGGEAAVQVEWRSKSAKVAPTDFFSDSQKQILMLSIFLAGGLRQNWSGFAPVLLDDPVTHFDDLNAYGFIELIRGIVSSRPQAWQFVISTCEDRMFALMRKKFERIAGGAVFYEYLGMTEEGPIVERR